jgi:hypothetical protein
MKLRRREKMHALEVSSAFLLHGETWKAVSTCLEETLTNLLYMHPILLHPGGYDESVDVPKPKRRDLRTQCCPLR